MKTNPRTAEYLQAALKALYSPPMTDEEIREFDRLRRRETARAEAKRRKSPQLELPEA